MYNRFWKRALDLMLSGLGLIVFSIPMLIVAVIIKMEDAGPVIFSQERVGIYKKTFTIYKFRSMKLSTPNVATDLLTDPEQYITKIGKFIRKTSIDELPQLWNIFKGDMSFVGPRPALGSQWELIALRDQYGANDVLPGLTGWAQINGRDELEIAVKARLDGEYAEKISFGFDWKCFFGTFGAVLKCEGVVEGDTGTLQAQKK